jgi:Zn-dependent peptidase ImmA (M78 family)/transcriptional regulator with XRE-family HTH domain
MTSETAGQRIARLRIARQMGQDVLAARIGRDRSAISRLENGERNVSAFELAEIAEALGSTVRELLGRQSPPAAMAVAHRVDTAAVPEHLEAARARARRLFELEALLDHLEFTGPSRPALPDVPIPTTGTASVQGRVLAETLRNTLELGAEPIPDLPEWLEGRVGVDVVLEPMPDEVAGLCVVVGGTALAMANSSFPLGRQRFTLAHELCHVLCGDPEEVRAECDLDEDWTSEETRASSFARHLLLPRAAIERRIAKDPTDRDVLALMYTYGISFRALLIQLHDFQIIDEHRRQTLIAAGPGRLSYMNGFRSEWTRAYRTCLGERRAPGRQEARCLRAYCEGLIGIGPIADLFGEADAEALRQRLAEDGVGPPPYEPDLDVLLT